jgi:uncharacterized membrane protein HdeD (DUF308 family)
MRDFLTRLADNATRTVKNWWLYLVGGILCLAAAVTIFCNPAESYATFTLLFGGIMIVMGIAELVTALTSHNFFMTRSYNIWGGFLDLFVGILLCANPGFTALALPVLLGIWLLYHSFMILGMAGDLRYFGVPRSGWGTAGGVLLLIMSLLIIFKPFSFGMKVIAILLGVAFAVAGVILIAGSINLRRLHRSVKEVFDAKIDY